MSRYIKNGRTFQSRLILHTFKFCIQIMLSKFKTSVLVLSCKRACTVETRRRLYATFRPFSILSTLAKVEVTLCDAEVEIN